MDLLSPKKAPRPAGSPAPKATESQLRAALKVGLYACLPIGHLNVCQCVCLCVSAACVCLFVSAMQAALGTLADSVPHEPESVITSTDQIICFAKSLSATTATLNKAMVPTPGYVISRATNAKP